MTRVAARFSSSGRLRLPLEENPNGSHYLAGPNTKNAQLIIAIGVFIFPMTFLLLNLKIEIIKSITLSVSL